MYRWNNGSVYEGNYKNDLRSGKGQFVWANGESYKGSYLKDERTGNGIYSWPDGSIYEGDFLSGKRHGKGIFISASGTIFEGEWFDDLLHGEGIMSDSNGSIFEGIWRHGQLVAQSTRSVLDFENSQVSQKKPSNESALSKDLEKKFTSSNKSDLKSLESQSKGGQFSDVIAQKITHQAPDSERLQPFILGKQDFPEEVTKVLDQKDEPFSEPLFSFPSVILNNITFELGFSELNLGGANASYEGPTFELGMNKTLINPSKNLGANFDFSYRYSYLSSSTSVTEINYYSASFRPFLEFDGDYHFLIIGFNEMDASRSKINSSFSYDHNSLLVGWGSQFNFKEINLPLEFEFSELGDVDVFKFSTLAAYKFSDDYEINLKYQFDLFDKFTGTTDKMHTFSFGVTMNF